MKILNKILDYKHKNNLKKNIVEIEKQADHTYKPVKDICLSIVHAAENCKLILKTDLKFEDKKEKDIAEILVFYEYLYFFIHLTLRLAFGKFTERQIKNLREYLGSLIVGTAIDSYTKHWPEDLIERMKNDFSANLKEADREYSECKVILDRDNPFSDNALFTKLAKNITKLTGHNNNQSKIVEIISTSTEEYAKMDLNKLEDEACSFPRKEKPEMPDRVILLQQSEKLPSRKKEKRRNRFSPIFSLGIFCALILVSMAVFFWPMIPDDFISSIGKIYPLRIDKPTGKSVIVPPVEDTKLKDQTENLSAMPVPSSVAKEASAKPDAQPTAVSPVPSGVAKEASADQNVQPTTILPIEEKKLKDQTEEISPAAPPKVTKNGQYAIQIIAYPEARKNDAMGFAKDLTKTQPDVYVERVDIRKRGVWYRILTGHFTSIEDATNYMKEKKILEAHPGSFVQLKSEARSSKPKPEAFAENLYKVAWKEGIILGLLVPPNTTKEQLKEFIYKIRQGKKDRTLSKFLPPVNLKFTDKYSNFIIFIFSDPKWATREAYMKYERSDMKSKEAKTYLNHIAASYWYDLNDEEYGSLGYDDGGIKSVHYKKLF